jgi:hypothetical protein
MKPRASTVEALRSLLSADEGQTVAQLEARIREAGGNRSYDECCAAMRILQRLGAAKRKHGGVWLAKSP